MHTEKHAIDYMINLPLRTPADIGALIWARRKELGYTQAELADMAGVSRLWINQLERGKPGAGLGHVLRTLGALGIELSEFDPNLDTGIPPVIAPDINAIIENAKIAIRK
jgi:HTH-type transcriptional regulator / antitoxin HipB